MYYSLLRDIILSVSILILIWNAGGSSFSKKEIYAYYTVLDRLICFHIL